VTCSFLNQLVILCRSLALVDQPAEDPARPYLRCRERGDLDEAVQILRTLTEVGHGNARQLAKLLTQQGRSREAERLRWFGLNPDGSIACE
jgi:hypothetical protein